MTKIVVGIYSLTSPARKLDSGDDRAILLRESDLAEALRARGFEVIPGGAPYPEEDRVAASSSMARRHAHTLMDFAPASVILNLAPGPRPGDVLEALRYLERELKAPLRLVLFADVREPDWAATLAAVGGLLRRTGYAHARAAGDPRDAAFVDRVAATVRFHAARHAAAKAAAETIHRLKKQKVLLIGPTLDRTIGESFDSEQLLDVLGPSVEVRPFAEVEQRTFDLLYGDRTTEVLDPRVVAGVERMKGRLDESGRRFEKALERQLALYHGIWDVVHESESTAVALNLTSRRSIPDPTMWMSAALLASPVGPGGRPKDVIPCAPLADPHAALAQMLVHLLTGLPSGFVTLRGAHERRTQWHARALNPALLDDAYTIDPEHGRFVGGVPIDAPFTLVSLWRDRRRYVLSALEGVSAAPARAADGVSVAIDTAVDAADVFAHWPGAHAVLCQGHHAAALVETAHRLDLGFDVTAIDGGRHERAS
jgi:L-fucose isomerase-like protein